MHMSKSWKNKKAASKKAKKKKAFKVIQQWSKNFFHPIAENLYLKQPIVYLWIKLVQRIQTMCLNVTACNCVS